mgnify:CR=1 FL=1
MEENCNYFLVYGEKNPHKFSIELERSNTIGSSKPQFSIDKMSNCSVDEKPSVNFSSKKTNSINNTNIFQITNIEDNNANDNNKYALSTKINENNDYKNLYEQKQLNNISKENENSDSNQNEYNTGRWTNEEHEKFIEGILKYGNEWKRVQSIIKTRSSTQARSHAQKFFLRMKKEISPKIISDQNLLIQYIINTSNNFKNYTELTQEQKEKLFSVIRSNLKPDEIQNKSSRDNQSINEDNKQFEYNNEEYDDLAYYKYNNISQNMSEKDNKRKITFCSKKRKSSSDLLLSINSNKIFNIRKDINHKKSMEISKTNNYMSNLTLKNIDEDQNNLNNFKKINNINNNYIINNNNINNNNFINNENFPNKSTSFNNYYGNTNFIIQNNYYNIINNFNNNSNINNIHNTYMSNDSFNSDVNNHNYKVFNCDNCKNKEKNNKNNSESMDFEKNININSKNIFENYTFLNNENFFPQLNKNECEQNDPFNLKFENETAHNDNIIMNDNIYLNNNIEEGHEIDDYESNIDKNNYCDTRPYDD